MITIIIINITIIIIIIIMMIMLIRAIVRNKVDLDPRRRVGRSSRWLRFPRGRQHHDDDDDDEDDDDDDDEDDDDDDDYDDDDADGDCDNGQVGEVVVWDRCHLNVTTIIKNQSAMEKLRSQESSSPSPRSPSSS